MITYVFFVYGSRAYGRSVVSSTPSRVHHEAAVKVLTLVLATGHTWVRFSNRATGIARAVHVLLDFFSLPSFCAAAAEDALTAAESDSEASSLRKVRMLTTETVERGPPIHGAAPRFSSNSAKHFGAHGALRAAIETLLWRSRFLSAAKSDTCSTH